MLYDKVKAICEEKGMSIHALEVQAVIGNGTIRAWNTSKPNLDSLNKVASVLNVKVTDLLE